MKKIILVALFSVLAFGSYDLKPVKISKSVYQFIGVLDKPSKDNGGNMVNSYWINTGKSYVVFDTGPSYRYAKEAHEAMKKIADLPISVVINSHMHDDHWLGNNYLKEQGATIYATKAQADKFPLGVKAHMMSVIKPEDSKGTKVIGIDKLITKSTTLNIDGREFEIYLFDYPVHTPSDLFMYLKDEKVLFSGDLLFAGRITSIRDGSVEGGLKSLKVMESYDVKTYAIGHGTFTDKTAINQMRDYFMALKTKAMEAIEEEVDMGTFVKTADFSAFDFQKMMDILHKPNLGFAYREYEFFEEEE